MQNMTADDEDILTFNCIFLPTRYYQSDISELAKQSKNENLTNLKLVANTSKHPAGGYYIAEQYDVIHITSFMLKYDTSIYEVINTYNGMVPDANEVEGNSNKSNLNDSVNSDSITIQGLFDKLDKLHNANRNVRNRANRVNPDNQANPLKSREMRPYEKIGY
ncbi:hypothetical protein C1646_760528 [Rhizophagus diaphanus]|nr:hypothetical protein C1646_760528 [Rhizophagus diaphanus] [Rhizophagus sp. MUCL 43196]